MVYNESTYSVSVYNKLISTTATDGTHTEWGASTPFTQGQFCKVPGLKRIYRCAAASGTGAFPPANPAVWTDYGAINSYKMFDEIIGSQTEFDTTLSFSIEGDAMNTLAFLNMENISEISVTQVDLITSEALPAKVYSLLDYGVLSLYDYWYKPVRYKQDLVIDDLEFMPSCRIDVVMSSPSTGKVGACVSGLSDELGISLFGGTVKLQDYSQYVSDAYGNTTFSPRGYARIITAQALIDTNLVDDTIAKLASLRGRITLFVGSSQGFGSMTTLGYVKDVSLTPEPTKTQFPIQFIGVI